MKFYGIECEGYLKVQEVAGTPTYTSVDDDRKIVRNTVDERVYVGSTAAGSYIEVIQDIDYSAIGGLPPNLATSMGDDFHPINGSVSETMTASQFIGDGTYISSTDDWFVLNDTQLISTKSVGIRVSTDGVVGNDARFYYDGTDDRWKMYNSSLYYNNAAVATEAFVTSAIGTSAGASFTQIELDARYVRYANTAPITGNTSWEDWNNLTETTLGNVVGTDRQIYYKGETFDGFVRTSAWLENTPAGTAVYADIGDPTVVALTIVQRDASGDIFANTGHLIATSALYADLAEKYTCDENLPVGTVVEVSDGTEFEVVPCMFELSPVVIGVVSRNPAHLMNSGSVGLPIGLTGKVEVRVLGAVTKGDFVVPAGNGLARKGEAHELSFKIGVALKTDLQSDEKLVECIIK